MSRNEKITTFYSPRNNGAQIIVGVDKAVIIHGSNGAHFADIDDAHTDPVIDQLNELISLMQDAIEELESR